MAINLEEIRRHYSKMNNARLERIAKFEIGSIQPEVQPIIIAEIEKRGLDENLLSAIEVQTKKLTRVEIYEYINKIKELDCPTCGKSNQGLVGGKIRKIIGYIVISHRETRPMIACRVCVDKERKSQLIKNSLLGWWELSFGFFYRTPQVIIKHFTDNDKKEAISDIVLSNFVVQNIGELKTNWDNEDKLVNLLMGMFTQPCLRFKNV